MKAFCAFVALAALFATASADLSSWDAAARRDGIVGPDAYIPELDLQAELSVTYTYDSSSIVPLCPGATKARDFFGGQWAVDGRTDANRTVYYTRNQPSVSWALNSPLSKTDLYTITLHDFDGSFSHYLAFNVLGNDLSSVGQVIHSFISPLNFVPRSNRYVWLVFKQPSLIKVSSGDIDKWTSDSFVGRTMVNVTEVADTYSLGAPVAINWHRLHVDEWATVAWSSLENSNWLSSTAMSIIKDKIMPLKNSCNSLGF